MVLPLLDSSRYSAYIKDGIALCQRLETFETATPARRVPLDTYDCTSARLSCHDKELARGLASIGVGCAFVFVDVRTAGGKRMLYTLIGLVRELSWPARMTSTAMKTPRTSESSHPKPYGNLRSENRAS